MDTNVAVADDDVNAVEVLEEVWAANFDDQAAVLRGVGPRARHVAVNVQYPGCVVPSPKHYHQLTPAERFATIRANVNALKLLQVGLAVRTDDGQSLTWEFNLRDFDVDSDADGRDPRSVAYLAGERGLDFRRLRKDGVDAARLRELLLGSGLLHGELSWATYTGAYHVAYLTKLVAGEDLPASLDAYTAMVRCLLGPHVYDGKRLSRELGEGWGSLGLTAASHLAVPISPTGEEPLLAGGSAMLTLQVFEALKAKLGDDKTLKLSHELCGLQAI